MVRRKYLFFLLAGVILCLALLARLLWVDDPRDGWKKAYRDFAIAFAVKGGETLLSNHLRKDLNSGDKAIQGLLALSKVVGQFGKKIVPYTSDLVEVSSSTNTEDLFELTQVIRFAGSSLDKPALHQILDNLYLQLDPTMEPELSTALFQDLFVNHYQGDLQKVFDALQGRYPDDCTFLALKILVEQEPRHPDTCKYLELLKANPDEIVSGIAGIYERRLGCLDVADATGETKPTSAENDTEGGIRPVD